MIPEAWESSSVRCIACSTHNAIVGGPFGSDLVSKDYVAYGVPIIRGQNMSSRWVSGARNAGARLRRTDRPLRRLPRRTALSD